MSKFDSPLKNIRIASPCSSDWSEMYGDERKRFCGECKLNVYNLSGMTRDEAESLIMNTEGRLCVRFYKRADGSVITADCPVGWAKIKQQTKIYATAVASLLMAFFTGVLFVSLFSNKQRGQMVGELVPFATPTPERTMGMVAIPPKNTNTNSSVMQGKPTMGDVSIEPTKTPTKFEAGKMRVLPNGDRKAS